MCISRFNPSEPCCGQSEKCQLCAGIDWNRYTYTVTHEETRRILGNTLYDIEAGEVVTRVPEGLQYRHDVVMRANNVQMWPLADNQKCNWYATPGFRGAWSWGEIPEETPSYSGLRSDFLSQWDGSRNNLLTVLPEEAIPGSWFWNSFQVSLNRTLEGVSSIGSVAGDVVWTSGLPGGDIEIDENIYFGALAVGYGSLFGFRLTYREQYHAFELRLQGDTEIFERIPRKLWNCNGPNVFTRLPNYSGPNIPPTVTIQLKRRKDSDRIFTAFRQDGNGNGVSLITSIPDLA